MKSKFDKVLIVDDNKEILVALKIFLRKYFKEIITLESPANLHFQLSQSSFDLIILDMNFRSGDNSGNEGLYWIREILKSDPDALIICITAYGAIQLAVKALQKGAMDFIEKPWDEEKFIASILRVARMRENSKKIKQLENRNKALSNASAPNLSWVKGHSKKMRGIWDSIEKIAPTDANIMITGENGTGKEIIARTIHNKSTRKEMPFVSVDLGALTGSLFESELFGYVKGAFTSAHADKAGWLEVANGGTLFMDEIGNLPVEKQTKLLTVLQNRVFTPVGSTKTMNLDVRILSATNSNLTKMVAEEAFREDLLYRLNTIIIDIPPLRERREDIPGFVSFYLDKFKRKYQKPNLEVNSKLMNRMINYSWPGNIRELKHSIERAVILSEGEKLNTSDFYFNNLHVSEHIGNNEDDLNLEKHEKKMIQTAINKARGNYTRAAELLGISRRTLYNKIDKYEI